MLLITSIAPGPAAWAEAGAGSGQAAASAPSAWRWPVSGDEGFGPGGPRVVAEYRAPPGPYGAGHRGIDLTVLGGDIRAPREGVVAFAGVVGERPLVVIDHPGGYRSTLEPVSPSVAVGDLVAAGQSLGALATGGHCTADCLHFGVRLRGSYVNPRGLLGTIPRAVLLPQGPG